MSRVSSAQVLVPRPVGELLSQPLTPVPGRVQLHLVEGWVPVHWTTTVLAHRATASWQRNRRRGTVTIDLLPAGPSSTLLVVDLPRVHRFRGASRWDVDAVELARLVRRQLTSLADQVRLAPVIRLDHRRRPVRADTPVPTRSFACSPDRTHPAPAVTAQHRPCRG